MSSYSTHCDLPHQTVAEYLSDAPFPVKTLFPPLNFKSSLLNCVKYFSLEEFDYVLYGLR